MYCHNLGRATFTAVCIAMVIILGAIMESSISGKAFANADSIKGIGAGVYWDQACTNRTLSLDWGLLDPGSNNTLTVYIRNEGNSAVHLWLDTSDWTPSAASGYMALSWNYSGQILGTYQLAPVALNLCVSPSIIEINHFTFTTTVYTTS